MRRRRTFRTVVSLGVLALLTLAIGCGSGKSKAEKAADELTAGLRAQVAGDTATATEEYNKALKNDPNNKFAHYNLGLIAQQAGQAAKAEQEYRLAISIDPTFVAALYNLAILRTGPAPSEAIELYQRAIAATPQDPGPHLNLGYLLKSQGRVDEGDLEIAKAAELSGNPQGSATTSPPSGPAPTTSTTAQP